MARQPAKGDPVSLVLPNIVLVTTDQQRADFTADSGFGLDTMPHLDSLGRTGFRSSRAYTTAPACVPARTSILTGRFPSAHRVSQNSTAEAVVRGDDVLDVLRSAGYSAHFSGKPHMYRQPHDFDSWCGPFMHTEAPARDEIDIDFDRYLNEIDHGPALEATPFPASRQYAYRIVSGAIDQLRTRDKARPFFSWLSFPEPHNPYQASEPYFSFFDPDGVPDRMAGPDTAPTKGEAWAWLQQLVERKRPGYDRLWRRYRATYCGMLRMVDDQLRRFTEFLQAEDVWKNTILIITSDHGDYVGDYGLQRKGAGMPDVLMRVPFAVIGPGVVQRDNADDHLSLADLLPTICDVVGRPIPAGSQGRSLWPMLVGEDYPAEEFASVYAEHGYGGLPYQRDDSPPLHFEYTGTSYDELNAMTQSGVAAMVRAGDWKLVYDLRGAGELYNLHRDPMELDNLWDDPSAQAHRHRLVEAMLTWRLRVTDDLPQGAYVPKRAEHGWVRHAVADSATTRQ